MTLKEARVFFRSICLLISFISFCSFDLEDVSQECIEWREIIDSSNNVVVIENRTREYLPIISGACQAELLNTLGNFYLMKNNQDSSFYYYNKGIDLADSLQAWEQLVTGLNGRAKCQSRFGFKDEAKATFAEVKTILDQGHAQASWGSYYRDMSLFYNESFDYYSAILYADSALVHVKNDAKETALQHHNKGVYYINLGDYHKAISQIISAIEVSQNLPNGNLSPMYYTLGYTYFETEQYEASKKAFEKSLSLAQKDNYLELALMVALKQANLYKVMGEKEKALEASNYALELIKQSVNQHEIAKTYLVRGMMMEELLENDDQALFFYKKSYDLAKQLTSKSRHSPTQQLAKFYIKKYQLADAKIILDELIELTNQFDQPELKSSTQKILSEYYEKLGQPQKALKHYKAFHTLNDSINNKEVRKQTTYFERQFDTKQKEIDILQLNEANRKHKQETVEAKSLQRKYLLSALCLGALFILGLYGSFVLNKQKKSLKKAHEKLSESNKIKNRLFSIIAHDVRGLIVPFQRTGKILGYHIDKGNSDRVKQISNELENNANQLSDMFDNLLKWSIDQMEGYETKVEEMRVKEELESIVSTFQEIAHYKSTEIQLLGNLNDTILIDKNAFHIILRNLIGNALKYTEDGIVKIDWKKTPELLELQVIDTGTGIDEKQIEKLFKLGNKVQKLGTKGEKGTGLGLHLVHQFIDKLSGQISVQSELNKGTTFSLKFPSYAA